MIKNGFKKNFLFFFFLNKFVINYIVIPFNREEKVINTSLSIEKQLEYFLEKDNIISTISFGEEQKGLELYLSLNEFIFSLSNDACLKNTNSSYNPLLSKSFKNTTDCIDIYINIKKYCRAIEKCTIYNDIYLNNNISIYNLSFIFGVNAYSGKIDNTSKICGNLGLQIFNKNGNQFRNDYFVNSLKQSNIINSYAWSILYLNNTIEKNDILNYTNKDYDGLLICGINENDYLSIFKTDNIKSIKAGNRGYDIYWDITNIKISYIYSNQNKNYESLDNRLTFNIEINYIIGSKSFFNSIKETFFNIPIQNNICTIIDKLQTMGTHIIICQKEIMKTINEFPKITFSNDKQDFIFELTYKDLFIEYNNRILFLIIYNQYGPDFWSLGKIFMRKYPFIFDYDKKTINFLNIYKIDKSNNDNNTQENENNSFWNYLKIIIIIILVIIGIIFGILIGKFLWNNNRKKRANELDDDDFEYINKEENKNEKKNDDSEIK